MEAYIQPLGAYLVEVSGESECQAQLEEICGGRKRHGVHYRMQPTLVISGEQVRVVVDGDAVGRIEDEYAPGYIRQLATTPFLGVTVWCEAMIVGGWDRGDGDRGNFGVKLDLPPNVLALDIIEGGPVWPDGSRKTPRGKAPSSRRPRLCGSTSPSAWESMACWGWSLVACIRVGEITKRRPRRHRVQP